MHPRPSSRDVYNDRKPTPNFELWHEIFCVDMFPYDDYEIVAIGPYHPSFVNISPTLVPNWYINGKVFTNTTAWKPKNLIFFSKKFKIQIMTFAKVLKSP